ncbi:fasciclin domain-containing protein [Flaviflexus salsibiostraticola]|uniref:Fasciclin domain-containing protein n=1 Tax=Flaviflexus salsibiostraticola TaxID=1282737 RepID=A0A3S8Z8L5_9ACTO|nr:fasciclin domain-containing protein [Flaviflexus salsibiostraticola]AZN29869.1 fasciclin domain-containing protein [Flaviflexus salsibiostraticola]
MTRSIRTRTSAVLSVAVLSVLTLAACSDDETTESESTMEETTMAEEETTMAEEETTESEEPDEMATIDGPFGPGCAAYVEANPTGPASVEGMAEGNVVDAVIANPELQTLKAAVAGELNPDVNLVETLAGGEFTVLAPINDAFAALPEEDLNAVVADADTLTSVLTYHVIPGRIGPDEIVGEHETVNGATVTVTGSGDDLQFNDAGLVCGNVDITNATVYMIDSVLLP